MRNLTHQILQMCGYEVITAQDGIEALKICKKSKQKIDLLITDMVMPQMSGRRLAKELAHLHPQMKILFTSGYMEDKTLLDDAKNLDRQFIPKPFTPDALANKVRDVLDKKEVASQ